jgi:hypothetical protein
VGGDGLEARRTCRGRLPVHFLSQFAERFMEITNQTGSGQLQGNALFYSRPEPLNVEAHGRLGLRRMDGPFLFAAHSQVTPLTVAEFPAAAVCYPIIFAGENYQPLVVMGINADSNMFILANGRFEPGTYIPAYIRRYPFVLANDATSEQLVVCIDRAAPMLGELPDLAFFDAAGQPTEYTLNCINFCNDFEVEVRRTESFVNLLREHDLFETRKAQFTPPRADGTPDVPQTVAEYYAVSETKLKALAPDKLNEFIQNGALGQIYTHLTSLQGWDRLIALTLTRGTPPPANLN